jgi:hypothetical protein
MLKFVCSGITVLASSQTILELAAMPMSTDPLLNNRSACYSTIEQNLYGTQVA